MNKPRVLVADDDYAIRDLFTRFLGRKDYTVTTAIDGFDALVKINEKHHDILIMDLKMPRMGGMRLLEELKELKKDLIIIVITGFATIETAKEAIKNGCYDYVTKPFDIEEISIVIKRALDMQRLVEEQKKLREQIQIAERLAALGQMGAGVAHEVNTVLTSVKLFLDTLKNRLPKTKETRNINLISEELERAEKLIERFLKFTKPTEKEFIKVDINRVIERSLEFLKYRFDKQNIKVSKNLSRELPAISCDPAGMEEVFLNVISNSIDAMPEGGTLTVQSEATEKNVSIVISDTGIGISQENITRLYDPFFTVKPDGTGLGLSIAHKIIDDHKGTIKITSEKNKGATVRIELPIKGME